MAITRAQMNALLKRLEGPIKTAFHLTIASARGRASIEALVQAIISGDMSAITTAAGMRDGMWSSLTEQVRSAYAQGGAFAVTKKIPKRLGGMFNINNPRAEQWLRNSAAQLITGDLIPSQIGAIQEILQAGMARGANPRTVALDIVGRISKETGRRTGGVLGLTQQQAKYVVNMANDLDNLDPHYFTRTLRDKRFDKVVQQAIDDGKPLSASTRAKIVARYEDRMLKHRGDTVGRTEALRAINESADEAVRQAVDSGLAPKNAVMRIWRHSFSANEREGHRMLSGTERGMDEYFTNPITGAVLKYPGDGPASETVNCRCYIEHKIDFAKVENKGEAPGTEPQAIVPPVVKPKPKPKAKPKAKLPFAPNLTVGSAAKDTTEEIVGALRKLPGAQQRVDKVASILQRHQISAAFVEDIGSMPSPQLKLLRDWVKKRSKGLQAVSRLPKDCDGLTSNWWDFVIVKSGRSILRHVEQSAKDLVTQATANWKSFLRYRYTTSGGDGLRTWAHEIGHQIHFKAGQEGVNAVVRRLTQQAAKKGTKHYAISDYAETNEWEFIAEHFSLWLLDRDTLLRYRPEIAQLIDDMVEAAYVKA